MKRIIRVAVLALVAAVLIYVLISRAGLTWGSLVRSIANFAGWALLCVLVLTATNLAIATLKWLLVSHALAPDLRPRVSFVDAMLTTTFGALLGQVVPFQFGVALARWLAGQVGVGQSARLNLGATIYEQLFDAIVLAAASAISILGLILRPGPVGWTLLILCSALSVAAFAPFLFSSVLAALARLVACLPSGKMPKSVLEFQSALDKSARLAPAVRRQLAILSILRYATIVAWVVVVLGALRMWYFITPVIIGVPLITLIGFVPVTPGNLGVTEWTWSAILMSAGASMSSAGLFSLMIRIINIAVLVILIAVQISFLLLQRVSIVWRWREG